MARDDALQAVSVAVGEGLRLLNFSSHSPSPMPGHIRYVGGAADLCDLYHWCDAVLALLTARGVRPGDVTTLIDAAF